jgi:hypothetical protein
MTKSLTRLITGSTKSSAYSLLQRECEQAKWIRLGIEYLMLFQIPVRCCLLCTTVVWDFIDKIMGTIGQIDVYQAALITGTLLYNRREY